MTHICITLVSPVHGACCCSMLCTYQDAKLIVWYVFVLLLKFAKPNEL